MPFVELLCVLLASTVRVMVSFVDLDGNYPVNDIGKSTHNANFIIESKVIYYCTSNNVDLKSK